MLKPEREHTPYDLASAQSTIPDCEARTLLFFRVPLAADQHQARDDRCFKYAKENSSCQKRLIVGSSCGTSCRYAPEYDVDPEPPTCWELVEEIHYLESA